VRRGLPLRVRGRWPMRWSRWFALLVAVGVAGVFFASACSADEPKAAKEGGAVRTDALGDPLPPGAVARFGTARLRHWRRVTFVAFLPDNKTLISAGDDRTIRSWDVTTGKELAPFEGKCSVYGAYALLADGKTLVSTYKDSAHGSTERGFWRWDVATRKPIGNLVPADSAGTFAPAAATPDGSLVATGHHLKIRLWDVATFRLVRELDGLAGSCRGLSISPDGKTLVACGDRNGASKDPPVGMWEVATGKQLWRAGGSQPVWSVVFLPDGKTVAVGGDAKGSVTLYDAATGEEKGVLRTGGWRLATSPDGKTLAIACVPTAQEWPGA
jgi:WD40 repeat protein